MLRERQRTKESPRAVKHTLRPCCTEKLRRERWREESCSVRRLSRAGTAIAAFDSLESGAKDESIRQTMVWLLSEGAT